MKKTTSFSYVVGLTKYFVATTVCVYTVHLLEILYSSKANLIETRTQHHKHVQQLTRHFSNIFHIVHITFSQSIKHANRSTHAQAPTRTHIQQANYNIRNCACLCLCLVGILNIADHFF